MTQAIVCGNHEGLVLAVDSAVLLEREGGQVERWLERKLYALGTHAAILTAGAPVGVELCAELSQWLRTRGLEDFDDVVALSRDFLGEGYARHLRANPAWLEGHHAGHRHLYFAIGGHSAGQAEPYQAILFCSEAGDLPFQETRLGHVFTLPRRVPLEGRIMRRIAEGMSLQALARSCREELEAAAERNQESIAAPFRVALVHAAGVELLGEAGA